jgi:hypothetical protein
MKKRRPTFVLLAALGLLPIAGRCSSTIIAHVLNFGFYGNGNAYVQVDQTIDQAGCPQTSLELPASDTANKGIIAVAAMAVATGTTIEVKTDICYNGSPSLDPTARNSFFISQPH